MIKALLFDFDGTLLNTNDLIVQTFMHVLEQQFPNQYTAEDCFNFIGPSLEQTFEQIDAARRDELVTLYRTWNAAHHDELVTEYEGVVETLTALHAQGIRLAIVSSKSTAGIERGMNVLGVSSLFEVTVSADDVQNVKPHPEPIFQALERMQLAREEVLMIGDNSHDIEAAHRAGVKAVGVAWSFKGEAFLRQYNPHYMLQRMADLLTIVKELNECEKPNVIK